MIKYLPVASVVYETCRLLSSEEAKVSQHWDISLSVAQDLQMMEEEI